MTTAHGIEQLAVVIQAKPNAAFVNMLDSLSQIVHKSSSVSRTLGKIDTNLGYSPFVQVLLSRLSHPNARARRLLLSVLTSIYEKHSSPKQLVRLHKLAPVLQEIQATDPGVLIRKVASSLYEALKVNDIL